MEAAYVNATGDDHQYCSYCGTVLWMCINIFTASATVLGNVLTISAILLSRKLSSVIANHFVFSLAVSDLLVGFSIPFHMYFYIKEDFGDTELNCLLRFVLTAFACASSICNLLFIATDRYVAIVYPLHYTRFMTRRTAVILIAMGWTASFSVAALPLVWNDWHEGARCEVLTVLPNNYLKWVVSPMFVLIWLIMLLVYTRICREASGHAKRIRSTQNLQATLAIKDSKSFQVMLLILGCFTVCWLPYFVITLYARTTGDLNTATPYEVFFNLAVANSSMNPLIYAWKNTSFRKAFLSLIRCRAPSTVSSANYVTNHVPSKKNSINGICNVLCNREDVVRHEAGLEMQISKVQCYSIGTDNGQSVICELTSEGSESRTIQ